MKPYVILYWNELKRNKILALLFLFAIQGFFLFFYSNPSKFFKDDYFFQMLFHTFYMLPFMLFYSFTSEQRTHKNYLLFSLPLQRSVIILIRYLALISTAVFLPVTVFIFPSLPLLRFPNLIEAAHNVVRLPFLLSPVFSNMSYFISFLKYLLAPFFLYAGIICMAESLHYIVKRYRTVTIFLFLMCAQFITFLGFKIIGWIYGDITLKRHLMEQNISFNITYMFVMGLLFLLLGVVLFRKYAEV